MTFKPSPDAITEDRIIESISIFTNGQHPEANTPHGMTALAVKSQASQVVLTGFQALATVRVARALEALVDRFDTFTESAKTTDESVKVLKEGLESIRRQLSANGS